MADNEAILRKLDEQDSLFRRLTMELNRLSKGKGIVDDEAGGGGAASGASKDEEIYIELNAGKVLEVPSRRRRRHEEDVAEYESKTL